jgi:catalase
LAAEFPSKLHLLLNRPIQTALIGSVVAGFVVSFAETAGWLTPGRLGPDRLTNDLEAPNGPPLGYRRADAKGVCIPGTFGPSAKARRLAEAKPDPFALDAADSVRSIALALRPLGADAEWRPAMNDTPGFPVNTPEGLCDQVIAEEPDPRTGKPDLARIKAFLAAQGCDWKGAQHAAGQLT